MPLLEGYRYEVLPALGDRDRVSFFRPFNYGLGRRLQEGRFQVLWVHGYNRWFHWQAMWQAQARGLKVLIRDEATLISAPRNFGKRLLKKGFFAGLKRLVDGFLAIGSFKPGILSALRDRGRKNFFGALRGGQRLFPGRGPEGRGLRPGGSCAGSWGWRRADRSFCSWAR